MRYLHVGALADPDGLEPRSRERFLAWIVAAERAVRSLGYGAWREPLAPAESLCLPIDDADTWRLRRALAYALNKRAIPPDASPNAATDDPVLEEELSVFRSHLVSVCGAEGLFVPVDFRRPVLDIGRLGLPGLAFGSSVALGRELALVRGALGEPPPGRDPFAAERRALAIWSRAAEASVRLGAALIGE